MKKVILLALLMPYPALGQIVDNFESQNTANWVQSIEGHWKADTLSSLSGMYSLHHVYDNPDAGTDQTGISTVNLHPDEGAAQWAFLVRYGYEPSSLNNWSVFLMSDAGPPNMSATGNTNGYAVGVNLTGSDDTLRLWKIKGSQITTVVKCHINWQTDIGTVKTIKIVVDRTMNGLWTVTVSENKANLIGTASGTDKELFGNSWFGIYYKYSSTRDRILWIDDVSIEGIFHENIPVIPIVAGTGDVILSEIMADPYPEVSLPSKEYIEITNRTDSVFNLKDWRLSTESQSVVFPDGALPASGIAILCSPDDTSLFRKYGNVIGLKSFPSLSDAGRLLFLTDNNGKLIHGVEYSSKWYNDELKSGGGWSLEMIDINFPFYDSENWTVSISKNGGTPGKLNSVSKSNPDLHFYGIENVFADDSTNIRLTFTEPVFGLNKNDCTISDEKVSEIQCVDSLHREYLIKPIHPLKRSESYNFLIKNIKDFAGNIIEKSEFSFGLAEMAEEGDLRFNELLFNPFPGDEDYIEFVNNSEKILNAFRLLVVSESETTGSLSDPVPLWNSDRCILPGEYFAITTIRKNILQRYYSADPEHLSEISSLPSMADDAGHLILYNRELDKIDEVSYDDDMQFSLLASSEGVALEKINPVLESNLATNWKSASETSGWGTPGAPNSVYTETPAASNEVVFSSTKISPDNDSYEDYLTISLNLQGTGNVLTVTIFDEAGNYIRKLASNLFVGAKSTITWDGTEADGSLVRTGIYIILITTYNDSGNTEKWKKVCTVIRR
jgi:hypothetical protein